MTFEELKNLCAEFGMEMIAYRNRIIYCNYVVGNYYFDRDCISYEISFIDSCVNTKNYETAQKEAIRKTKEIKDYINQKKLEKIKEVFE